MCLGNASTTGFLTGSQKPKKMQGLTLLFHKKSSVKGGRTNKDDISKASGLIDFYKENPKANLYIATFVICFKPDMTIGLERCIVFPTAWIPDVYVNPSNNGNLQSSKYKDLKFAVKRTPEEFHTCLVQANKVAQAKRKDKG